MIYLFTANIFITTFCKKSSNCELNDGTETRALFYQNVGKKENSQVHLCEIHNCRIYSSTLSFAAFHDFNEILLKVKR